MVDAKPIRMRGFLMLLLLGSIRIAAADSPDIPPECADLAKLAASPSANQALSARIALANCLADQRVKPLVLCDCEQSVNEVNTVVEPSLAMLDEVAAAADPGMQVLARFAQAELLVGVQTRMLATVPAPGNASEGAIALHDLRVQMLQQLMAPWVERAQNAYRDLDRIARANPQLAKNTAVVTAVRTSRTRMSQQAAKR